VCSLKKRTSADRTRCSNTAASRLISATAKRNLCTSSSEALLKPNDCGLIELFPKCPMPANAGLDEEPPLALNKCAGRLEEEEGGVERCCRISDAHVHGEETKSGENLHFD
jgi:hypothetical protein